MTTRKLDRRTVIKAGALLAAPFIVRPLRAQDNIVYVNTYGGAWTATERKHFYEPFTAKTGIQVRAVEPVSFTKLKAQVQSGNYEWDCTALNMIDFLQATSEGLTEPLDFSIINKAAMPPGAIVHNGIRNVILGTNIVYRKDKMPKGGPQSWKDFWDVAKFPGRRSLYAQAPLPLEWALLADGVPRDKLYPLDIDRAFKKLDQIKPHILVWWSQNSQADQLIKDGEVDMIGMHNARAQLHIDQGVPLELVWNDGRTDGGAWFVAKGTPRKKLAMQFIEFTIGAKAQGEFCSVLPYGPSNPEAFKFMTPEAVAKSPTSPEHLKNGYVADAEWITPHIAQIKERFAQWIAT